MAFFPESKAPPSALAIASLSIGGAALVLVCLAPIIPALAAPIIFIGAGPLLGLPAFIMGFAALIVIARKTPPRQGKGFAAAGIALGLAGLLVPALLYAASPQLFTLRTYRDTLNRAADGENARTILLNLKRVAAKNKGVLPPHLAVIVPGLRSHSVLIAKNSKTPILPPLPAEMSWQDSAQQVDAHCDYHYIGADITLAGLLDANQIIILYSKDIYPDHARLVGFADGHVQWMAASSIQSAFDNSNVQRGANSLPALALDGPPPLPKSQIASAQTKNADPPPPPPPEVKTLAEAISSLKAMSLDHRQVALNFLLATPPDPEHRVEISLLLESAVAEPSLRVSALTALKTWATPQNVPGLVKRLNALKDDNPAESAYLLRALGGTGDVEHVGDILAKQLERPNTRTAAKEAFIDLGPGAEPIVILMLDHRDAAVGRAACNILAQIGTAKSLPSLKAVIAATRNQGLKNDAQEAIKAIESRIANP